MKRVLVLALVALLCVSLAGLAVAKNKGNKPVKVKTIPFIINPPTTKGLAAAAWVTHQGLPDAGKSDHALFFMKDAAALKDTLPGATVKGVNGLVLTELGFDYRLDGLALAVSMVVKVTGGGTTTFTIPAGPPTIIAPNWAEVRFDLGAGIADVDTITIYFDWGSTPPAEGEADFIYLDNIDVNGALMGKPGNAKVPAS